jgi:hypothetical protein
LFSTHSAVYRRTWKCDNGVRDCSERRSRIIWEQWIWETGAAGILFGGGGGDEQQVVTVRSCVCKKKYCNFVVNVVLRKNLEGVQLIVVIFVYPKVHCRRYEIMYLKCQCCVVYIITC